MATKKYYIWKTKLDRHRHRHRHRSDLSIHNSRMTVKAVAVLSGSQDVSGVVYFTDDGSGNLSQAIIISDMRDHREIVSSELYHRGLNAQFLL